MDGRTIGPELRLIPYYPDYATTLPWYQDLSLCKQVDSRDAPYDLELLQRMYNYLNAHGDLFYIQYQATLCGDVCLQPSGEINIVIANPFKTSTSASSLPLPVKRASPSCTRRFIRLTPNPKPCFKASDSSKQSPSGIPSAFRLQSAKIRNQSPGFVCFCPVFR